MAMPIAPSSVGRGRVSEGPCREDRGVRTVPRHANEAYGAVMLHTDADLQAIRLGDDAAGNFNVKAAAGLLGAVTVATLDERRRPEGVCTSD